MTPFTDYLDQRLEAGGFTTEDALAGFLPLVRQVVAAHRGGMVAPLQGVNTIQVENGRLWFEESQLRKPMLETSKLRELEKQASAAIEVKAMDALTAERTAQRKGHERFGGQVEVLEVLRTDMPVPAA